MFTLVNEANEPVSTATASLTVLFFVIFAASHAVNVMFEDAESKRKRKIRVAALITVSLSLVGLFGTLVTLFLRLI